MRIQKCTDTHGQQVTCLKCEKQMQLSDAYADLDGEPWKAYYHKKCLPEIECPQMTRLQGMGYVGCNKPPLPGESALVFKPVTDCPDSCKYHY